MTEPDPAKATETPVHGRGRLAKMVQSIGLIAGAGLALLAASQGWWRITTATEGSAPATISGNETTGGLAYVLPLVALAGWLLSLSLRGVGRRIVAVLLLLTGAAMVATGIPRQPPASVVEKAGGSMGLDPVLSLAATPWPYLFGAAGLLVAVGAVAAFIAAGSVPKRVSRFERTANAAAVTTEDDPSQIWKALDQGADPTSADPTSADPASDESGSDRRGG